MKRISLILVLFILLNTAFAGNNKTTKAQEAKAKEWVKKQQLEFIENKGQFTTTEGKPADNVLFKTSFGSCDIYITDKGLSYVFYKITNHELRITKEKNARHNWEKEIREKGQDTNKKVSYYRLDMDLVGASILKENIIKEEESQQGHYNYFYPHCPEGIYDVKGFGKITIKNIYKGIDWVIYTNKNNKDHPLKYDFIVHPEANYNDIKIKYLNAQSQTLLDKDTKLKIETIAGNIEEGNIYSYQNKDKVKSNYVLNNDSTISFSINEYDKTKDLVIDPLVWATYYGGNNYENFNSITTDNNDNLFITGSSRSTDFPTQQLNGAYWQPNNVGAALTDDIIILKFNCRGVRLWVTYYGGSDKDGAYAICIDSKDNIYITGYTMSTNFPLQQLSGAYWQNTNAAAINSTYNAFILKFNDLGIRQWATYYGGDDFDIPYSMCIDSHDNIYLTGIAGSGTFPTQQLMGAYWQPTFLGTEDAFILKFNNQGVRQWATFYGGELWDGAKSICVDSHDNVYITGWTCSSGFPLQQKAGAFWQTTPPTQLGAYIIFILEFDENGARQWCTYYGGSRTDGASSICTDSHDNIYITGGTESLDFPTLQLVGAYWQPHLAAFNTNAFILKFNSLGVRQWATYFGGSYIDEGAFIKLDKQNNIYLTGVSTSLDLPVQQIAGEYWQPSISGSQDAFILKFNDQGVKEWCTYYGSSYQAWGVGLALNNNNDLFMIGSIQDSGAYTVDLGNGAYYDNNSHNYYDGFILKFSSNNIPTTLHSNKNIICSWDNSSITLSAEGNFTNNLKWYTGGCGQNYIGKNTPLIIASPKVTTTYYASLESSCYQYCDSIKIYVVNCDSSDIYIPNAFTPNGDGKNEVFKIETLKEFSEFNLYIYDRWGELIFESSDINIGWDGTYKGKTVPDGVYVYLLKATIKDTNEQIRKSGRVTVVR